MKRLIKIMSCGLLIMLTGCKQEPEEPVKVEKVEIQSNEVYESPKNPSNEMALVFNQLTKAIEDEDIEKISENAAICFVYDFFTLKNKENSSDVGGLTYLPQSRVEEFTSFAQQHFYKNYDSIISELGKDSLPEVVNVVVDNVTSKEVTYLDYTYDGYEYEMSVEYAKTKLSQEELKTTLTMSVITYEGKAMVIAVK